MGRLRLRRIDSIGGLRDVAAAWDRLWQRSAVSMPTVRAELVAQWLEHFAGRAAWQALVVESDGEPVAALPVAGRRFRGVLPVGDLTWNYWSPNAELLLDPGADVPAVVDLLAGAIDELPWPLLCLEMVPFEQPYWQALLGALTRRGLATELRPGYRIGQVEIGGRYEDYQARWSKNHRRTVLKDARRLERAGPVELKVESDLTPEEVDDRLRRAFEIEDRSWKRGGGRPVLRVPGMFEFYCRQARQLAAWGYLRLSFLECRGEPIAFEMGWTAKGVYHSFKVSYDESYRRYGPGHLLRMHLIRSFYDGPGPEVVDFQGPLSEALANWSTRSYPIGRLVIAPRRLGSRTLLAAYRGAASVVRRFRVAAGTLADRA